MKTKNMKRARTALRWGLFSLVIGIIGLVISFIISLFLTYDYLNPMQLETVFAIGGSLFFALGSLTVFFVSLSFLPGIIQYATQNTQKHLAQNKTGYRSAAKAIFYGIGLLFVALFKVWAFLIANRSESDDDGEDTFYDYGSWFVDCNYNSQEYWTWVEEIEKEEANRA